MYLHGGLLEDRSAQSAPFPAPANGRPRAGRNPPLRGNDRPGDRPASVPGHSGRRSKITVSARSISRGLDAGVLQRLSAAGKVPASEEDFMAAQDPSWAALKRCRERDECREKLRGLGVVE